MLAAAVIALCMLRQLRVPRRAVTENELFKPHCSFIDCTVQVLAVDAGAEACAADAVMTTSPPPLLLLLMMLLLLLLLLLLLPMMVVMTMTMPSVTPTARL